MVTNDNNGCMCRKLIISLFSGVHKNIGGIKSEQN